MYKHRFYTWSRIKDLTVFESVLAPFTGMASIIEPRAIITFDDGKSIVINGRLLEKKKPLAAGFENAFDELVFTIKKGQKA